MRQLAWHKQIILCCTFYSLPACAFHASSLTATEKQQRHICESTLMRPTLARRFKTATKAVNEDQNEKVSLQYQVWYKVKILSLNQVLYVLIMAVSSFRLVDWVPKMEGGDATMRYLTLNVAFNFILFVGAAAFLVKSFDSIDYEDLEGLDQKSLAELAGQWAVRGVVPTHCENFAIATFAGGCFWGAELHFQRIPGIVATCVGYTQGWVGKPTYEQVCSGRTGHTEGIQLLYDPTVCPYEVLLNKLFQTINPTLLNQVRNDRGTQYRHGIYTHTKEQNEIAAKFVSDIQKQYASPIVTELLPATVFWPAENYHQRYLEKRGQSAEKNCQDKVRCYG